MKKETKILLLLILSSIIIKFTNIGFTNCISTNGMYFVSLAKNFLNGEYEEAFTAYIPFLYPILIALGNYLINNLEISGQVIAAISGTGIIFILYQLGKEMFGVRIGLLAGLFAAISPIFNTYSSRVMDDMPYGFLYAWSVYAGWRFLNKQDYKSGLYFALLAALAYLIRPEGLGILLIVSAWFILAKQERGASIFRRIAIITGVNLFFFICILPQILIIHHITGEFSFSGKTSYILRDIDKFDTENRILNGQELQPEATAFGFEDWERREYKREGGLFGILIHYPGVIMKKLGHNLKGYLLNIPRACGYLLAIPLCFGIFFRKQLRYKRREELFLLTIILFNLLSLSLFKEKYRHLISIVPFLYIWAVIGIDEIVPLIKGIRRKTQVLANGNSLIPIALSICIFATLPQTFSNISEHNYSWRDSPEKKAGQWLSQNIPKESRIISWEAGKVLYYADIPPSFTLSDGDNYGYIIKVAMELDADYLLVNSHESKKTKKYLLDLFSQIKKNDLTICYKTKYPHSDDDIRLYRFTKYTKPL